MRYRKPNRLKFYDYSNAGWYYITICTNEHKNHFGKIENEKMILNEMGKTVEKIWLNIQEHYPFTALDEYIIMPNHIHGIIIIDYDVNVVGDENFRPLHKTNLSNVIKGFKIGVTKWCKTYNHNQFQMAAFIL